MIAYIDEHKTEFGVEPICRELPIAPQTYYASKTRPPSKRSVSDETTTADIRKIHKDNFGVYGVRKVHAQLRRDGKALARCTVERLMRPRGSTRYSALQRATDHDPWAADGQARRPRRTTLHSSRAGLSLRCRHHLHSDVADSIGRRNTGLFKRA